MVLFQYAVVYLVRGLSDRMARQGRISGILTASGGIAGSGERRRILQEHSPREQGMAQRCKLGSAR